MKADPLLQIVSGFKPSVDGMGDFARRLGRALWQHDLIRSHFLVYRQPQVALDLSEIAPNTLSYPVEATSSAFRDSLAALKDLAAFKDQPACALLHYGPYAYSRTGQPAAFVREIKALSARMRVVVFFHETYATGLPWKRAFWTNAEQKKAVDDLLELADVAFTSNPKYMLRLKGRNKSTRPLIEIPIFSNIGEPGELRPINKRSRRMVIFGQLATRNRLYKNHRQDLENLCRQLTIESVVDVGAGISPDMPQTLDKAAVKSTGWMEEQQLSELMSDSIAGVIGYWPDVWQKSGVLAAYFAHALLPIMIELEPRNIPRPAFLPYVQPTELAGLLLPGSPVLMDSQVQAMADAAHDYYIHNQSVRHCAEVIAPFIRPAQGGDR